MEVIYILTADRDVSESDPRSDPHSSSVHYCEDHFQSRLLYPQFKYMTFMYS